MCCCSHNYCEPEVCSSWETSNTNYSLQYTYILIMYHLVKGIYSNLTRKEGKLQLENLYFNIILTFISTEYSVLVLGLDNAGKTVSKLMQS